MNTSLPHVEKRLLTKTMVEKRYLLCVIENVMSLFHVFIAPENSREFYQQRFKKANN